MASTNKALAATADQNAGPATRAHHHMGESCTPFAPALASRARERSSSRVF